MSRIVSTPDQAIRNIERFESELARSPELQDRLAYARAWYAYRDDAGTWRFGPSKFVGYEDMDAETYLRTAPENDGRRTEAQLRSFFKLADLTDPLYPELNSALIAFLAKYGKAPSTKTRINIARPPLRRSLSTEQSTDDAHTAVVRLMVEVARTLPSEHLRELRNQIEDIWS